MFLSAAFAALILAAPPAPFEFKDGDRIVWLGSTLVEREQRFGYWETALLVANPGKKLTIRNLGWSGDTVHGEARGRFQFNDLNFCFKQIVEPTLELKPTVIFISYGTNESFEGKDGLPKFEKGLEKLLDALKPAKARIVLFSPPPFEKSPSLTDPKPANRRLALYADAIKATAAKRGLYFVNLFAEVEGAIEIHNTATESNPEKPGIRFTDNGMHFTEAGYRVLAGDEFLTPLTLKSHSLDWAKLEPLRQAVIAKNEQFFNKWRPQNETYLFGFRKHEQGKNAKEMAEFDPFIAKAEDEIEKLRKALVK